MDASDGGPVADATTGRDSAVERIRAMTDLDAAYAEAVKLVDDQQHGRGEAAQLKREIIRKIWETREMSIAGLAAVTRTSRTRAHQLKKDAYATTEDGNG